MPEQDDIQAALEAAEQAAGAGDFTVAEEQLRRVLELQESALGDAHPELANTLNNLGVVYERLEQPDAAERSYRRAFAIARAALGADHPSAATSAENLRQFCAARGLPFELPSTPSPPPPSPPPPSPVTPPPRVAPPVAGPPPVVKAPGVSPPEPVMAAPRGNGLSRTVIVVALIVAALIVVAIVMRPSREGGTFPTASIESAPATTPRTPVEAAPEPPATQAPATEEPTAEEPAPPARVATPPAPSTPKTSSPPMRAEAAVTPTVKDARLCRSLQTGAEWHCAPLEGVAEGGAVYYFTTIASPADTTIQHRWYRGDRLHQAVTLRIAATPSGYRTYSQLTVTSARAGDWRVEVRAADGTVLRQDRFSIGN